MTIAVRIKQLPHHFGLDFPQYATLKSAGMDLVAANSEAVILSRGAKAIIPTGIAIALPEGYEAQIRPRSGLAAKNGVTVLNTPGTIDADYRGEIKVILINHGSEDFIIEKGMRIAQMVIAKYEHVNLTLENFDENETERGSGGFGSTGVTSK